MTCPLANCIAPACRPGGRAWRAKSAAPADVKAFKADVVAYMQMTDRRDAGKCAAIVFNLATKGCERECLLS